MLVAGAQTLGGNAAFNFLSFPAATQAAAAGGLNVSYRQGDVGFATQNPALLKPSMHGQAAMHFSDLVAGVKGVQLSGALYKPKPDATIAGNIFFIHYGSVPQTDAAGNEMGNFNAYDYVVQVSGSKKYLQQWQYGGTVKWIQSLYGPYSASALAGDVGLLFTDSAKGWSAGFVAKNMGFQVKAFEREKEDLPFDLQVGVTKKLLQAPLSFSLTAHHQHRFSILYNDTTFNQQVNFTTSNTFLKKVFNHFVFATHIEVGKYLEATLGYNFLRRSELSVGTVGNGLTGSSAGLSARFQKMQFHYARSSYQKGIGNNQIGISINVATISGAGLF